MNWKFVSVVPDGYELKINGVNVWSKKWNLVNEAVDVIDPKYHQPHKLGVYTIHDHGVVIKFAAGEFSNSVWAFYVPEEE